LIIAVAAEGRGERGGKQQIVPGAAVKRDREGGEVGGGDRTGDVRQRGKERVGKGGADELLEVAVDGDPVIERQPSDGIDGGADGLEIRRGGIVGIEAEDAQIEGDAEVRGREVQGVVTLEIDDLELAVEAGDEFVVAVVADGFVVALVKDEDVMAGAADKDVVAGATV
jgi:hypothetical protein